MRHTLTGPWACTRDEFVMVVKTAQTFHANPSAFGFFLDDAPDPESHTFEVRDGTAILPIVGPLFRRSDRFSRIFGESTYDLLLEDVNSALADAAIDRIVLDIDSGGGDALGISELSNRIREGRGEKEIVAVVRGLGASAAYFLASAAETVVVAPDAMVGSIGTVMRILDFSKMLEMEGIEEIEIVATQSPRKRPDATTSRGRAQLQEEVNAIAQVFVEAVAENRGVSPDRVLADFGQGGVFVGEEAVAAGLADEVATLDEVLADRRNPTTPRGQREEEEEPMSRVRIEDINESWLAEHLPELANTLRDQGRTEASTAAATERETAVEAARLQARTEERERVESIRAALEGTGQEGLFAELAADPEASAATAHERVTQATRDANASAEASRRARLSARVDDENELPAVEPSTGDDPEPETASRRKVGNVVSMARRMGLAPQSSE